MNTKKLPYLIIALLTIFLTCIFVACNKNNSSGDSEVKPTTGLAFSDFEEDTCWVVGIGTATDKDIIVPDSYNGKRVVGIAFQAFLSQNITSIVIPEGVETIQDSAFYNCKQLRSVKLPSTLTRIESGAFGLCEALESFEFPANLSYFGNGVFRRCISLKAIELPVSISTLSDETFEGCMGLENVAIPSNIKVVGERAFEHCSGLTSVRFESAPDLIKDSCFYGCNSINRVEVETIADWLHINFETATSNPIYIAKRLYVAGNELTSLEVTEGIEKINDNAFVSCQGLKSIVVGGSVKTIGAYAFGACNSLEEVVLQDGIETIGTSAFNGCFVFESINFPTTIRSVGSSAFSGTRGLKKVEITDLSAWLQIKFGDNSANPLVYAHKLYLNGEEIKDLVIPDGVERINAHAFAFGDFKNITIPESVSLIGDEAFVSCQKLEEISFGGGILVIGYGAFYECPTVKVNISNLKSWCESDLYDSPARCAYAFYVNGEKLTNLVIPSGITKIGYGAFSYVTSISEVHFPDEEYEISRYAFLNCTGIKRLEVPDKAQIDKEAFCGCDRVAYIKANAKNAAVTANKFKEQTLEIEITSGETLEDNAFAYLHGLTKVTLPEGLKTIGNNAFRACTSLEDIEFPSSLQAIGWGAFSYTPIASCELPASITSIGGHAFSHCENLISIVLPANITYVGEDVFERCENFVYSEYDNAYYVGTEANPYFVLIKAKNKDIVSCQIHSDTKIIAARAFSEFNNLVEIEIPSNVVTILDEAFYGCNNLQTVVINDGVEIIEQGAFSYCGSLRNLIMPSTLKMAGIIVSNSPNIVYNELENGLYLGNTTNPNVVLCGIVNSQWDNFVIQDGTKVVLPYACGLNCETFTVPNSVVYFGPQACWGLHANEIHVSDLTAWCSIKFETDYSNPLCGSGMLVLNGEEQTNLVLPDSLTKINDYAFAMFRALESVRIPNGVEEIGAMAFELCDLCDEAYFDGTVAEWGAIKKASDWNRLLGASVIHCTNGDVDLVNQNS